mgnify:CR=1 FL=1
MHPEVELVGISSKSYLGQKIADLYPSFYQIIDLPFEEEDSVIAKSDVVFASLPHGLSEPLAKKCDTLKKVFIDLGADFRLDNEADYQEWYHLQYQEPQLHKKAVYGLPELFREDIKTASIIGNPGCYPTSIALALAPLMKLDIINEQHLIIDSKSGTTGSGKGLSDSTHFPRLNESFAPYKIGAHRHTPEIEEQLGYAANQEVLLNFTPHLIPMNRGILITAYAKLKKGVNEVDVAKAYQCYDDEYFVRVLKSGVLPEVRSVKASNFVDINYKVDPRTNRVIMMGAMDNLVKGAAGQAIQNMNIMFGLDEKEGLMLAPAIL